MQGITIPKRIDIWHQTFANMMGGFAKQMANGNDKKMLFIKYEVFCQQPETELKRIYAFLEIPYYQHDLAKIEQTVREDEEVYEYTGMLKIRSKLQINQSDAIEVLGKDVYNWIMQAYGEYNNYFGYK